MVLKERFRCVLSGTDSAEWFDFESQIKAGNRLQIDQSSERQTLSANVLKDVLFCKSHHRYGEMHLSGIASWATSSVPALWSHLRRGVGGVGGRGWGWGEPTTSQTLHEGGPSAVSNGTPLAFTDGNSLTRRSVYTRRLRAAV